MSRYLLSLIILSEKVSLTSDQLLSGDKISNYSIISYGVLRSSIAIKKYIIILFFYVGRNVFLKH